MFFTFVAGYDLDSTSIQITPETFAPDRLCSCSPGWIPSCLRLIGCDQKIRDVSLTSGSFPQLHPNCNSHKTASLLTATWPRKGSGAKCEKCPENSFAENYDSKECEQCPQGSKAPAGSVSHSSCICDVGVLDNRTGQWTLCSTWQFVRCNSMFPNLFSTPLAMPKSARSTVS